MRRGVVFSIEGNIGSGKSTLLNILSNRIPHLKILPEPVKNWQNVGGHNILHTYYNQPKRWAYTFQSYALLTRITTFYENLNSQAINGIIFSERSIATDKQIFAKLLSQENLMNQMEFQIYQQMYGKLQTLFPTQIVHKHIYLQASPEKCLERIRKRGRSQEKSIKLDYLQKINELHEQWLADSQLVINAQNEFESNQQFITNISQTIQTYCTTNQQRIKQIRLRYGPVLA